MEIWKSQKMEIGYLLFPYMKVEQLIEHGICCPFEGNWNGVWIGLDGELNFPYGNSIYCYKNLPEKFNKEMYFVIVVAVLPGVDCKRMEKYICIQLLTF